ncbi:unnamed protein product [Penicillium pancosmium]
MADDQRIFSEFLDPHRQKLIQNMIQRDFELAEIPRSRFFALWFSDMTVLEKLSTTIKKSDSMYRRRTFQLTKLECENWPGIFAAGKHPPKNELSLVVLALVEPQSLISRKFRIGGRDPEPNHPEPYRQAGPVRPARSSKPFSSGPAKNATRQRGSNKRILTQHGRTTLEVTHNVPFKLHMTN